MLIQLSIKNFAIFKDTVIDFRNGFNVITGESGAGKSIFITALSLLNGERALKEYIRKGAEYSLIEAVYNVTDKISAVLKSEHDLDIEDNLLVITRTIYSESSSICKINGKLRTLSFLKDITSLFCDIHGQYENQTLLDSSTHLGILDDLYPDVINELSQQYLTLLAEYNALVKYLQINVGSEQERETRKDILEYQINEIETSNVEKMNIEELDTQRKLMENSEKYLNVINESINYLEQNDTVENIYLASNVLEKFKDIEDISKTSQNLLSEYINIKESLSFLKDLIYDFTFDEALYDETIQKLELFKKLSKKYGKSVEDIMEFRTNAQKQLEDILNFDLIYAQKIKRVNELSDLLSDKAEQLNNARHANSIEFSSSVESNLHDLEMPDAVFKVNFTKTLTKNKLGYYDFPSKGIYEIEFFISANKGIEPMPLAKIASGGEISRIMLAIKCIIASMDKVDTYIFDEIDAGISGEAAIVTSLKLHELSLFKQVICISHLPQIAARADHHYMIFKSSDTDIAYAEIKNLDYEQRILQLAVLFDGKNVTAEGMKHAENILKNKKNID